MAPSVLTVLSAARTGSRVVRYLIRPARRHVSPGLPDPWLPGRAGGRGLRRGASLARRALGLLALLVLSLLGTLLFAPLIVVLGIGTASGVDVAGWLLGVTLLLAAVGAGWTVWRVNRLLNAAPEPASAAVSLGNAALPPGALPAGQDEAHLLTLWRAGERALPPSTRPALHATVIATRDALRATASDTALDRDAFDARQAAREDLPALLHTYQAAPRSPETERLILGQLELIGRRMQAVAQERRGVHVRTLEAQRRYLKSKYGEDRE